ncbi:hypothetical protein AVEN_151629-1 [Araneus ventricosus]|uniref:Uncharacterized protein n=1 Tax=Araneus ventricosus TaxID=182803 RepID=A0A4Y2RWS5_ARAVE|nr:hypothetical protein AVEN_151629-1 [Araneus ventricosus]
MSRIWGRRVPGSKPESTEDPSCIWPVDSYFPALSFQGSSTDGGAVAFPEEISSRPALREAAIMHQLSRATENNGASSPIVFPGVDRHWTISRTNGMFMRVILACSNDLIC